MSRLIINGGRRLQGSMKLHGAKNSILPILAAVYVTNGQSVLHNCPDLTDVHLACGILRTLGCRVEQIHDTIVADPNGAGGSMIAAQFMRKMRSSIVFLGAMLARTQRATLCAPGGCNLGPRPIDLHVDALRRMGACIDETDGTMYCTAPNGLRGTEICFPFVSVGATENVLIAAVTAKGRTIIRNAACEPEVTDLAAYLQACGAQIRGVGTACLEIDGVPRLHGAVHTVVPDRIEAATYLTAAAVSSGEMILENARTEHLRPILQCLCESGCTVRTTSNAVYLRAPARLTAFSEVKTAPYPQFPTDAQAILMAAAAVANGKTCFEENVFSDRFRHAAELKRMGAQIDINGSTAVVKGVFPLHGAEVRATDLRGGAALVVAALSAVGRTEILEVQHIDRGYEKMECVLSNLGADIWREHTWLQHEKSETPRCQPAV